MFSQIGNCLGGLRPNDCLLCVYVCANAARVINERPVFLTELELTAFVNNCIINMQL